MARHDRPLAEHRTWMAQVMEEALEPALPICDPHHHLWLDNGHTGWPYALADFHRDTSAGHNIVRSVFVECRTAYRNDGPAHLRPIGETAFAAEQAQLSVASAKAEIAAIVGYADMTLGDAVEEVLLTHEQAGRGRFRGVRYTTAQDADPGLAMRPSAAMDDPAYLAGVRRVGALGYSYDAMVYHPQLTQLASVARACENTPIVINHLGGFVGVGPYRGHREACLAQWRTAMDELASCPNTFLKVGGIGMPLMGFRWDKQAAPPTSEALAAPWIEPIRYVIDTFGPSRCMFESNFPVDHRGASYVVLWNAFKRIAAGYSASEKRELFHDCAARAYRL